MPNSSTRIIGSRQSRSMFKETARRCTKTSSLAERSAVQDATLELECQVYYYALEPLLRQLEIPQGYKETRFLESVAESSIDDANYQGKPITFWEFPVRELVLRLPEIPPPQRAASYKDADRLSARLKDEVYRETAYSEVRAVMKDNGWKVTDETSLIIIYTSDRGERSGQAFPLDQFQPGSE